MEIDAKNEEILIFVNFYKISPFTVNVKEESMYEEGMDHI